MAASRHLVWIGKTLLDLTILAGVFCLTFVLRFEGTLPAEYLDVMLRALPFVVFVKLVWLLVLGVPKLAWRFVSMHEAMRILVALALGSLMLLAWRAAAERADRLPLPHWHAPVPFGVLLLDLPLSLLGLVGMRAAVRLLIERQERNRLHDGERESVPTLLIGAGRAGAIVAREVAARPDTGIQALGFLDDAPGNVGQVIHGLPVLGSTSQLAEIARLHGATQALITMVDAPAAVIRQIVKRCEDCGIPVKTIPELHEIVGGRVNLSRLRDVAIEDIMQRPAVQLDLDAIAGFVQGQVVCITGAGGSIGSELCRVVCRFNPQALVLIEKAENNLFHVNWQLSQEFPEVQLIPCLADISDGPKMDQLLTSYQPAVLFHAAAHKHVPLMEAHPEEAIRNNVLGTKTLADLAHHHGVGVFVMISTDKAVRPTSVMGVSKRVAELYIQSLSQWSPTRFVAVRFGNVLGSAGSVVPIFKKQIAQGGPVTITHPEMQRYFMTIPEACQLVLQAASMGQGGEIFILDMGEPVKIVDLARDLIRLSGLRPEDIEIQYTGIRPGEKLFEELALQEECAEKTQHPRIFIGRLQPQDWAEINGQVEELGQLAEGATAAQIHARFQEIVPEYQYPSADVAETVGWLRVDPEAAAAGHHLKVEEGKGELVLEH